MQVLNNKIIFLLVEIEKKKILSIFYNIINVNKLFGQSSNLFHIGMSIFQNLL